MKYLGGQIGKRSLICLNGKSITPDQVCTFLLRSSHKISPLPLGSRGPSRAPDSLCLLLSDTVRCGAPGVENTYRKL